MKASNSLGESDGKVAEAPSRAWESASHLTPIIDKPGRLAFDLYVFGKRRNNVAMNTYAGGIYRLAA